MATHAAPPASSASSPKASPKASTNAAPVLLEIPKSVYVVPTNPKEGRDPFFPNSTRGYAAAGNKSGKIASIGEAILDLKGFSGTSSHRLAIINNRTFGVGEEGEVVTSTGRYRIRCVAITDDSVSIEMGGERRELRFRSKR